MKPIPSFRIRPQEKSTDCSSIESGKPTFLGTVISGISKNGPQPSVVHKVDLSLSSG